MTSTSIGTGIDSTFIDILFTMCTGESSQAVTLVVTYKVDAGAAILARIHCTIINVAFTIHSRETGRTNTLVLIFVGRVDKASASVFARSVHATLVNFDVAIDTGVSGFAPALVTSRCINAVSTVFAGFVIALLSG